MQSSPVSQSLSIVQSRASSKLPSKKSTLNMSSVGLVDKNAVKTDINKLIDSQISEEKLDVQYWKTLKSARFKMMVISVSCIAACPLTLLINFKVIGLTMYDDASLSRFAIVGAVSASLGRLLSGWMIDQMG